MCSLISFIFFISAFFVDGDIKMMGAFIVSGLFAIAGAINSKE